MTTCKHAPSGCNYPEGECAGSCMARTQPAAPSTKPAPASGDREAMIQRYIELNNANYTDDDVQELGAWASDAYDMLAAGALDLADIQEKLDYTKAICQQEARAVDEDGQTINSLRAEIAELKAQQVAVPQGWKLVPIDNSVDSKTFAKMVLAVRGAMTHEGFNEQSDIEAAKAWRGNASHLVRSIIAAAPQPPQAAPMTDERLQFLSGEYADLPDDGPAFRDGFRAAEAHHGITK